MAKQRTVNTHFWDDKYTSELKPFEKLLFLYLITNPLTNIAGVYEIRIKQIAFDTGLDQEAILRILKKFEDDKKVIYYADCEYIVLINWVKHQKLTDSVKQGIIRVIQHDTPTAVVKNTFDKVGGVWGVSGLLNLTKPNSTEPNANSEDPTNLRLHFIEESPFSDLDTFLREANEDPEIKRMNADLKYYHNYWVTSCKASKKTSYNWFQEIKRYIFSKQFDDNFKKNKPAEDKNWK